MSNNIAKLRTMETKALASGGTIDAKEAKALYDAAKKSGSKEDLAAVKEMFSRDAFVSEKLEGQYLKKVKAEESPIAGSKVGNTAVVRSYGDPAGYSNKFQAIATAQQQAPFGFPVAVVKDPNGKWHAVQTREALTSTDLDAGFPLKHANVADWVNANKLPETTDAEKMIKAKKLAVASLGVPEGLVNVGAGKKHFDAGKINVDITKTSGNGAHHVHSKSCRCDAGSIELSLGRLKNAPDFAAATLFHEGQHKADGDVLEGRVSAKTGTEKSSKGNLAVGAVSNESSAYGRAFVATVDKNKEVALDQLLGYLDNEINQAARPNQLNTSLRADMVKEMKAHYATLPEDLQKQFKEVVAVGELYHPKSTLWTELFGKESKPAVSKTDIPVGSKRGGE